MRLAESTLWLSLSLVATASGCSRSTEPAPVLSGQVAFAKEADESPGFAFAQDEGGRLAFERLAAGRAEAVSPVPFVMSPKPWRAAKLEQLPNLPMAPIDTPTTGHLLAPANSRVVRIRPALDVPPLAMGDKAPLPLLPAFLPGPKARVETPNPLAVPPLITSGRPPEALLPFVDPTEEASRQAALVGIALLRNQPAPFLRLTIPDPFENLKAVRLRSAPVEPIEPAAPIGRPPLPPMQVTK
jgi:hypothetical protein